MRVLHESCVKVIERLDPVGEATLVRQGLQKHGLPPLVCLINVETDWLGGGPVVLLRRERAVREGCGYCRAAMEAGAFGVGGAGEVEGTRGALLIQTWRHHGVSFLVTDRGLLHKRKEGNV